MYDKEIFRDIALITFGTFLGFFFYNLLFKKNKKLDNYNDETKPSIKSIPSQLSLYSRPDVVRHVQFADPISIEYKYDVYLSSDTEDEFISNKNDLSRFFLFHKDPSIDLFTTYIPKNKSLYESYKEYVLPIQSKTYYDKYTNSNNIDS
ncbi:hypothetical protein WA158_000427 [Blastocystis sp. Blastoise]